LHSILSANSFYIEITLFWNDPDKLTEFIVDVVERHQSLPLSRYSEAYYENDFHLTLMKEAMNTSFLLLLK